MFHSVRCFILSPPGWKLSLNALRIKTAATDNNLPITHQHSCQLPPWLILQPVVYTWLLPVRSENAPRNRSSEINISFASKRFYAYVVITQKKEKVLWGNRTCKQQSPGILASCSCLLSGSFITDLSKIHSSYSQNGVWATSSHPFLIFTVLALQHNTHLQEHELIRVSSRLALSSWYIYKTANITRRHLEARLLGGGIWKVMCGYRGN